MYLITVPAMRDCYVMVHSFSAVPKWMACAGGELGRSHETMGSFAERKEG